MVRYHRSEGLGAKRSLNLVLLRTKHAKTPRTHMHGVACAALACSQGRQPPGIGSRVLLPLLPLDPLPGQARHARAAALCAWAGLGRVALGSCQRPSP